MKINAIWLAAIAGMCCWATVAAAEPRSQLQQDVEGFAVATCLTAQEDPFLLGQGDGWGSIIINRGYGNVEDWQPLVEAVTNTVGEQTTPVVSGGKVGETVEMPLFQCFSILDEEAVQAAIAATMDIMAPAYEGR